MFLKISGLTESGVAHEQHETKIYRKKITKERKKYMNGTKE